MKKSLLRSKLVGLAIVIMLIGNTLLAGCGGSTDSAGGGTLKIATMQNIVNLGFAPQTQAVQDFLVAGTALESLGRFDTKGTMQPWLAESWEADANAKTITFKLKKGIKFHDGTDFNAKAVQWNLDQYVQAKRGELKALQSTEIIDDYTIKLNLAKWNSSFLDAVAYFVVMSSPTAYDKNGGKDWAIKNPVGTGPFQFESWEADVAVKFKKFDGYWQKGKPKLDAVEWRIISDPMTAIAAFKAKEVDEIFNVPSDSIKPLEDSGATIVRLKTGLGALGTGLIADSANPQSPFANVLVRQAVSYAINVKSIADNLLKGNVIVTNQWGVPGSWSYNPELKGFPYNPEKGKQLLAEAGYPNGFKTKLTCVNAPETVQVMTAVQSDLAKIGIDAQLDLVDNAKFREMTDKDHTWEGLIQYNSRGDADVVTYMPRNFSATGVLYVKGIAHPEKVEKLLVDAAQATDLKTKQTAAFELQKAVYEEYALATAMFVSTLPAAKHPYVKDEGISMTHASVWTPGDASISK